MPDEPTPQMEWIANRVCQTVNRELGWHNHGLSIPTDWIFKYVHKAVIDAMKNDAGMCRDRRGGWRQLGVYDG